MVIPGTRLQKKEQMIFDLRAMYADYGFAQFKIRKFEEYELYVKNKDFLDSVNIITFTDTNGKLMALKPDVTLSIVKNSRDIPGTVQKVYYNENIYRVSKRSHMFEELTQVGIECIGDIDDYNICEVLSLAAKTLKRISDESMLVISDLDIPSIIMEYYQVDEDIREDLIACMGEKNAHTLGRICEENKIPVQVSDLLVKLCYMYGRPEDVLSELTRIAETLPSEMKESIAERMDHLEEVFSCFNGSGLMDMIRIDFSVVSDVNYYNGIVFNGFVEGLPDCIVSGGQYDRLMKKMKRSSRAIGFGVYMDRVERFLADDREFDIDVLLLYEKDADPAALRSAVDGLIEEGNTVLAQRVRPEKMTYRKLMSFENGEVTEIEDDKCSTP